MSSERIEELEAEVRTWQAGCLSAIAAHRKALRTVVEELDKLVSSPKPQICRLRKDIDIQTRALEERYPWLHQTESHNG